MRRQTLKMLIAVLSGLLILELAFMGFLALKGSGEEDILMTLPAQTQAPTGEATLPPETDTPTTAPSLETTAPTEITTAPTETEPQEQRYVLTFVGDCTLGSDPSDFASQHSFIGTIKEDYSYPFRNVLDYFENDDFTFINLESVLADSNAGETSKRFTFRGPTAYTQILTGSSVEAVTLANNHTEDFGKEGYASTKESLDGTEVTYVEEDKTKLYTTESGLTIGMYADSFYLSVADIQKNVGALKSQGAEIIVCAFHWGNEGSYRPTNDQQVFAKAAIDAGADIVYGSHPHVLQKIETYKDGIIYYSLGNFSFGGNNFPRDLDSALLQQEIIRDVDGTVRLGTLEIVPVSITSMQVQNNFQPTPYEKDSDAYKRTLSKLDGTFTGPDLTVDYSFMDPTDPTEAPTTAPEGTDPPTPETTDPPAPPASDPPAPPATDAPPPENPGGGEEDGGGSGEESPPPPADGGDGGGGGEG